LRAGKPGILQKLCSLLEPVADVSSVRRIKFKQGMVVAMLQNMEAGIAAQIAHEFFVVTNWHRQFGATVFCEQKFFRQAVGADGVGAHVRDDREVHRQSAF